MNAPAAREQTRTAMTGGGHPLIRPLDPRDAHHLADLFGRLSPSSRRLRYLTPMSTLPAAHLRHLAAVDHQAHEAVGAFEAGELVGVAHYFRSREEPRRAEIAVEVADVHQRHGLGRRLLVELARLARDRGITHFTAIALAENPGVRGMFAAAPMAHHHAHRRDRDRPDDASPPSGTMLPVAPGWTGVVTGGRAVRLAGAHPNWGVH